MEWRLNHVGQMAQSVQDYSTGISVKELVLEEGLLKEEELKEILKPEKMTQPMREKVMKAVS